MTSELHGTVSGPAQLRRLALVASLALVPFSAEAQLRMSVWRADSGLTYQVLQHRAGDDFGVGIDEVRVTSVVANSYAANTCASPPLSSSMNGSLEAIASGPIGGARPLDLGYKSGLIADASVPCFASSAADGLGALCFGPACTGACVCADGDACETFTISDGVSMSTATPETPAAQVIAPLQIVQPHCRVNNEFTYGFGAGGQITTRASICAAAPADGVRLSATPSAFNGGRAGTTIVFAYYATADDTVMAAAAGFGIDSDGQNPFSCDAPGRVVAALEASGDDGEVVLPPRPPVDLQPDEQRCQQAIGRAARRLSTRILRAVQYCRDRILDGSWQIAAAQCFDQPMVDRSVDSAALMARSGIAGRCSGVDLSRLLVCGDQIDDLIRADGAAGCLFDTHKTTAEQMAIVQYGF